MTNLKLFISSTAAMDGITCYKCKDRPAEVESRAEYFCKECFINYLQYKNRKRLDDFKVNYDDKHAQLPSVVLPLSLSKSSIATLDMLVSLIRQQHTRHHGKQGFELKAIHVCLDNNEKATVDKLLCSLETAYPECKFLCYSIEDYANNQFGDYSTVELHTLEEKDPVLKPTELLAILRENDKSSYQDLEQILLEITIRHIARQLNASCIAWGHSMTKIAQLTCSMTCKGRGESLHQLLSGENSDLDERFPMQDLLSSEIEKYLVLCELTAFTLPPKPPPSSKRFQSIDELASEYFLSVEAGFPSVVATVVRTASKLAEPHLDSERASLFCNICHRKSFADSEEWQSNITVDGTSSRALNGICYGCRTALYTVNAAAFKWPRPHH